MIRIICANPALFLLTISLFIDDEDLPGNGAFGALLMFFSCVLIILFFPFSLFYTIKVSSIVISVTTCTAPCAAVLVQHVGCANCLVLLQIVTEYERAVILRLGRLTSRKAKGPGVIMA